MWSFSSLPGIAVQLSSLERAAESCAGDWGEVDEGAVEPPHRLDLPIHQLAVVHCVGRVAGVLRQELLLLFSSHCGGRKKDGDIKEASIRRARHLSL
jgi:hypothetical protein